MFQRDSELSLEDLYERIRVTAKVTHKKLDAMFRILALVQREDSTIMDQNQALTDAVSALGVTMTSFISDSASASNDILNELSLIQSQPGAPDLSGVIASVSSMNSAAGAADLALQTTLAKVNALPAPAPAPVATAPDGSPQAPQATTPPQPAPVDPSLIAPPPAAVDPSLISPAPVPVDPATGLPSTDPTTGLPVPPPSI